MSLNQVSLQRLLMVALCILCSLELSTGFATQSKITTTTRISQRSSLRMYVPQQSSSQSSSPAKELNMIPKSRSITSPPTREKKPSLLLQDKQQQKQTQQPRKQRYNTELSHSVLHESDTLPSFPTAHGLLSPETVMRMEEMVEMNGHTSSAAVKQFLTRYRRNGPMSCLSMLSDPQVLPHLTKAMRDIV